MNNNFDISKCKPFDLQRAIAGDPIVTRDGRAARFGTHSENAEGNNVVAWVVNSNGQESLCTYYNNGNYHKTGQSNYDLFMLPKERTVWVNAYKTATSATGLSVTTNPYPTYQDALQSADTKEGYYIGTFPITIQE